MSDIGSIITTSPTPIEAVISTERAVASVTTLRPRVTQTPSGATVDFVSVTRTTSAGTQPGLDTLPPAAPTNVQAISISEGAQGVLVLWTDPPDYDLTSVRVYRSLSVGGTYSLVATVAKGVLGWLDEDATDNITYWYRLDAIDTAGNISPLTTPISVVGGAPEEALHLLASATEYLAWNEDGDPLIWRD